MNRVVFVVLSCTGEIVMKGKQHRMAGCRSASYLIDHIRVTDTNEHLSVRTNEVVVCLFFFERKGHENENR